MLLFVLRRAVGEEVNEMQLAGWIGTTEISWLHIPGWMGTWLSLFNNWETFIGQFIALALVVGSYLAAQYVRVWRPRRHGRARADRTGASAPARHRAVATSQTGLVGWPSLAQLRPYPLTSAPYCRCAPAFAAHPCPYGWTRQ